MKSRLDLLLIHPNGRSAYQGLADLAAIEPPLWCAMLARYVIWKGHSVKILDAEVLNAPPDSVADTVAELDPLLACVVVYGHHPSASTQIMPAASATVASIKRREPHRLTMLLGGHAAALPERTLREEGADLVCTGEGFVTLDRALTAFKGGLRNLDGVKSVPGLLSWSGRPPDSALVEDLDDEVPDPAWGLLPPFENYRAHNWHAFGSARRSPYASLYTTLGCPYSCGFCCIQAPFRSGDMVKLRAAAEKQRSVAAFNSYRRWSPARVGRTLEKLYLAGVEHVKIADEMFVLNRAHVEGVCEEIRRLRLHLNLWAYARTDTVKDGMPEKLKAAGFNWLAFGIESGSARVRGASSKPLQEDEIHRTLEKVRAAGIHVIGNYIIGLPGETSESIGETLKLATELNTEFANFYVAMAYPGSALYSQAVLQRPHDLPSTWAGYSQLGLRAWPLRTDALSAEAILGARDQAFVSYHSSPRYQEMISRTFGEETLQEVKRMVAAPIHRSLER